MRKAAPPPPPPPPPLARFRLYAEDDSRLYALVNVWPTKAALAAHAPGGAGAPIGRGTDGTCTDLTVTHYRRGRPARRDPLVCEVNLWRGALTPEVVAHELFHAALAWGRRRRFDFRRLGREASPVNADEEWLAYVHSTLLRDFVRRATAAGLLS